MHLLVIGLPIGALIASRTSNRCTPSRPMHLLLLGATIGARPRFKVPLEPCSPPAGRAPPIHGRLDGDLRRGRLDDQERIGERIGLADDAERSITTYAIVGNFPLLGFPFVD